MDPIDESLYLETIHAFLTVYRYLRQYSRQMQEEGLSGRRIAALRYLHEAGPHTVGQLRDYLYISDSSTSELVSSLEREGYVARARSEADNRVVVVSLTAAGRSLAKDTLLGGVPLLRERLKPLPPERLRRIYEALSEIARLLELPHER